MFHVQCNQRIPHVPQIDHGAIRTPRVASQLDCLIYEIQVEWFSYVQ